MFTAPFFTNETPFTYGVGMMVGLLIMSLAIVEEGSADYGQIKPVFGTSTANALIGAGLVVYPFVVETSVGFMAICLTVGFALVVAEGFNFIAASRLVARIQPL